MALRRDRIGCRVRVRFAIAVPERRWIVLRRWLRNRSETPGLRRLETWTPEAHVHLLRLSSREGPDRAGDGVASARIPGRHTRATLELGIRMGAAGTRPVTGAVVKRLVRAIVGAIDPEQIILFGSRARGSHGMDSDIDLLVVQSEPFDAARSRYRESVRAYEAVSGMGVATDILVYSRPEVEYWRDSLNHVVARALREGEVLYERPEMRSDARSVRGA